MTLRERGKVVHDKSVRKGVLGSYTMTVGAEAANAITVNVQALDEAGNEMAEGCQAAWWLSTDSAGQAISTAPSGGTAAGTDGHLIEWTAQISGLAVFEADGDADFVLTDTATRNIYLNIGLPDGTFQTSGVLAFST
jgi:hypothetical protein